MSLNVNSSIEISSTQLFATSLSQSQSLSGNGPLDGEEFRLSQRTHTIVGIGREQAGETDLIQRIDSDVTNMNTVSKSFITIPWKFKCPLKCPVQNNK